MAPILTLMALAAALSAPRSEVPVAVEAALERTLSLKGAELRVVNYRPQVPSACSFTRAEVPKPILSSGQVAVHVFGRTAQGEGCEGWAWVTVRVFAPVQVTTRTIREGEPLQGAVRSEAREVLGGRQWLVQLSADSVAARPLASGQALIQSDERIGPRPGEAVAVAIRIGALEVEETGRAVPCVTGRSCALLPSGKRVEGRFRQGRLMVDTP